MPWDFFQLSESEQAAAAEALVGKNAMSGFLALMNAGEGDIEKLTTAIDGCSDFKRFIRIVLPLSKAIIAVIALYVAVGIWNDYFYAMIYLSSPERISLQVVLREILIMNSTNDFTMSDIAALRKQELIKYCIIIVSTLPMMIFYPFLQKYFTKGVMIGSIKG